MPSAPASSLNTSCFEQCFPAFTRDILCRYIRKHRSEPEITVSSRAVALSAQFLLAIRTQLQVLQLVLVVGHADRAGYRLAANKQVQSSGANSTLLHEQGTSRYV